MTRKKKILIGAGAAAGIAVLSVGGISTAFATGAVHNDRDHADKPLTGSTLTKASDAAVQAAGGGKVSDSSTSDEAGSAYEVEVTTTNGQQVDVHLDKGFAVVKKETEAPETPDQPLTGATLTQASAAAIQAAGGGTVTETQASDEPGSAYEVEVTTTNGQHVDVHLDKSFSVVKTETDSGH